MPRQRKALSSDAARSAPPSHPPSSPKSRAVAQPPPTQLRSHIKKRLPKKPDSLAAEKMADTPDEERRPLLHSDGPAGQSGDAATWSRRNQWILLAVASGACAAFNGMFAKLTTNELTTNLAQGIAHLLGLSSIETAIEFVVRCMFFGLNLVFNGIMWTLFTQALARGNSTTQVSIMNTSSNFFITAILGFAIFSESLPPLWWLGAALLVAGNVIIGRKDEGKAEEESSSNDFNNDAASATSLAEIDAATQQHLPQVAGVVAAAVPGEEKDDDEDIADIGALVEDET
ncbi:hypothetical protein GQ53DRAFT_744883 [Thozetella sp. PMI_491]|nr:hypothetical protein GQ53DRAFT_744883 [Thozetella sp. PMI_491]